MDEVGIERWRKSEGREGEGGDPATEGRKGGKGVRVRSVDGDWKRIHHRSKNSLSPLETFARLFLFSRGGRMRRKSAMEKLSRLIERCRIHWGPATVKLA